jgi:hypothetical protein
MKCQQQQQLPRGSSQYAGFGLEDKDIVLDRETERKQKDRYIYIYIYNQIDNKREGYLDTSKYLCSCLFIQLDLCQYVTPHLTS